MCPAAGIILLMPIVVSGLFYLKYKRDKERFYRQNLLQEYLFKKTGLDYDLVIMSRAYQDYYR